MMGKHSQEHLTGEMPKCHLYQGTLFIVFITVWSLDSFVFRLTTLTPNIVLIWMSVLCAIIVMIFALQLMNASHKVLFESSDMGLFTTGAFSRVRHPLYLGTCLVYLSLAIGTLSLLSIVLWVVVFLVYDAIASYEERLLESKFGAEYADYRARVRKWIPIRKRQMKQVGTI
ncbi:MAG: hypothetical protein C4K49_12080 [Candidatus Thorarchaeota archaeon]|nr:MAG: hypothetical protein C4K49_12080 [Candidatus Thorarchaeota archaeon]